MLVRGVPVEKCESFVDDFFDEGGANRQSTSGSWVTMWTSTAGDSRKKRWTMLR